MQMNLALTGSGLKQGAQTFRGVSPPLCAGERREHDGAQPGGAGGHAAQHQAGGERPPAGGAAGRPPAAGAGTHHPSLCSLPLSDPPTPAPRVFLFLHPPLPSGLSHPPLSGTRANLPGPPPFSLIFVDSGMPQEVAFARCGGPGRKRAIVSARHPPLFTC